MIQSASSATSVAALNVTSTAKAAAVKTQAAAVPVLDPVKAVAALKAADTQAFMQRQQIGAALYDRSFTYAEGAKALARQDAIAAYATKIQAQPGGPTEKQLAALTRKLERAEAQIQRLSTNGQGADLNSIKGVDGKVVDDTQSNLSARIAAGVKDGTLTADEAKTLTEQQAKISELEKGLRESNGKLTAGEQKQVLDELRKSADAINKARANTVGVAASTVTYADRVNERQAALEKQLEQGLKLGSLTQDEAATVRQQFDGVNAAEKEALANGSVNWREATALSSLMNEAEAQIYELQRNSSGKQLAEVYVNPDYIDQRQTGQLEGITRGIDNRSLTNEEATTLLNGQQAIDDQQAVAVEGGLNRAEYLRLQSAMNDQSLSANTLGTNAARYTGLVPPPAAAAAYAAVAANAPKPVASTPAPVTPNPSVAPVSTAPTPVVVAPVAPSSATPGNSGSTPAASNSNGAVNGNVPGNSGSASGSGSSTGSTPIVANPVVSAPVPPTAATPAPATPVAAAPAAPAIETPASDVKAETTAETQPTTVQINRELANDDNLLPKLMAKMMEEQRANLQRYAEQLSDKADEAKRQSARDEQHRSEAKGDIHAALSGDVVAKVSSYARTDASTSAPATPVLAKKVA